MRLDHRVTAVEPDGGASERWSVRAGGSRHGPFDAVVNALWEGRPVVDETVGHRPDTAQQHRYRLSVFAAHEPSARHAVRGPRRRALRRREELRRALLLPLVVPARPPGSGRDRGTAPRARAARRGPRAARRRGLRRAGGAPAVGGGDRCGEPTRSGWRAVGCTRRAEACSTIRRRPSTRASCLGVTNVGTYFSVDTGKYSVAPTLAEQIALAITAAGQDGPS